MTPAIRKNLAEARELFIQDESQARVLYNLDRHADQHLVGMLWGRHCEEGRSFMKFAIRS